MYILGTHNSWSYLPERKQWMKCTRFLAKCQNCDIKTQYYTGVRCFDLRLRWSDKYQDFVLCHGITTYVGDYEFDLSWLNIKAQEQKEGIYVRVLLEDSGKANEFVDEEFFKICKQLEENHPFLCFFGGFPARKRWRQYIYRFKEEYSIDEKHGSVCGKFLTKIPYIYSKLNNHKILQEGTNCKILMIDFI